MKFSFEHVSLGVIHCSAYINSSMKRKLPVIVLLVLNLLFLQNAVFSQYQPSFTVRFLKARFTDTTSKKEVMLIFHVSVADTANYPPQINYPPKCSIYVNGQPQIVPIGPGSVKLALYDDRIMIKNVQVYDLIKNKINLQDKNKMIIMVFSVPISNPEPFKKLAFTFSLSEKRNAKLRWEKQFDCDVE